MILNFGAGNPSDFITGGYFKAKSMGESFDGEYVDFCVQSLNGKLEGKMNIVVMAVSENQTKVTVNARYVFTTHRPDVGSNTWVFNSGNWEMISAKWTSPDTTYLFPITDHDRQIKMISRTHFVWISQDTSRKDVYGFGGGKYTLDGDKYTEHIEIFYDPIWIGKSITFTMKVEGDTLIQSGTTALKKLGLADYDMETYEVYKRLD